MKSNFEIHSATDKLKIPQVIVTKAYKIKSNSKTRNNWLQFSLSESAKIMPRLVITPELLRKKVFFEIKIPKGKLLNFSEIFDNNNPVHLEIGSGKGEFSKQKSILEPDNNFLGIELKAKRIFTILKKINELENPNVRLDQFYVDEYIT